MESEKAQILKVGLFFCERRSMSANQLRFEAQKVQSKLTFHIQIKLLIFFVHSKTKNVKNLNFLEKKRVNKVCKRGGGHLAAFVVCYDHTGQLTVAPHCDYC